MESTEKFGGAGDSAAAALSPLVFLAPAGFHRRGLELGRHVGVVVVVGSSVVGGGVGYGVVVVVLGATFLVV